MMSIYIWEKKISFEVRVREHHIQTVYKQIKVRGRRELVQSYHTLLKQTIDRGHG